MTKLRSGEANCSTSATGIHWSVARSIRLGESLRSSRRTVSGSGEALLQIPRPVPIRCDFHGVVSLSRRVLEKVGNSTFVAPVFSRLDARAGGRFLHAFPSCDCFLRRIQLSCIYFCVSFPAVSFAQRLGEAQGITVLSTFMDYCAIHLYFIRGLLCHPP